LLLLLLLHLATAGAAWPLLLLLTAAEVGDSCRIRADADSKRPDE
jgi:hypothetical protein